MTPITAGRRLGIFPKAIFWIVAAFYAYGALVHILDIVYLVLDVVVVVGLLRGSWIGVGAFFLAATSQIALYTVFRGWVLDVPAAFQRSSEDLAYLNGLVGFHTLTCIAVTAAVVVVRMSPMMHPNGGH